MQMNVEHISKGLVKHFLLQLQKCIYYFIKLICRGIYTLKLLQREEPIVGVSTQINEFLNVIWRAVPNVAANEVQGD